MANVLVILVDDMRFDFLPYMASVNNYLVREGRTWAQARVNTPVCPTTRWGMMTGQRYDTYYVAPPGVSIPNWTTDPTLYDSLLGKWVQDAGYRTGIIGKVDNSGTPYEPHPDGWDTWLQLHSATGYSQEGYVCSDGTGNVATTGRQNAWLASQAVTFMGGSEPWFLHWASTDPHTPTDIETQDQFKWNHLVWPVVLEADLADKPSWIRRQSAVTPLTENDVGLIRNTARQQLYELESLDRAIGTMLATVDFTDTTVIFTSDNGLFYGEHGNHVFGNSKNDIYEPGLRVPLVARGPGITPGVTNAPALVGVDVTATVVAITGATPDRPQDGVSLLTDSASTRSLLHRKRGSDDAIVQSPYSANALTTYNGSGAYRRLIRHENFGLVSTPTIAASSVSTTDRTANEVVGLGAFAFQPDELLIIDVYATAIGGPGAITGITVSGTPISDVTSIGTAEPTVIDSVTTRKLQRFSARGTGVYGSISITNGPYALSSLSYTITAVGQAANIVQTVTDFADATADPYDMTMAAFAEATNYHLTTIVASTTVSAPATVSGDGATLLFEGNHGSPAAEFVVFHEINDTTPSMAHTARGWWTGIATEIGTQPLAADKYEMYDLDTDPNELTNVAYVGGRLTERNALEAEMDALL